VNRTVRAPNTRSGAQAADIELARLIVEVTSGGAAPSAHISVGSQCDRAREALEQLRDVALRAETRPLRAALFTAEATLAAALGDRDAARRGWEDAIDALAGSPAQYEIGRARLGLAAVLDADGRVAEAHAQARAAVEAFRQLGADAEAAAAEAMLGRLDRVRSPGADDGPLAALSQREREVVTLVAVCVSNREIAARLVISEHTVRHVTSILRKLGLPSRAAATSLAARHGLGKPVLAISRTAARWLVRAKSMACSRAYGRLGDGHADRWRVRTPCPPGGPVGRHPKEGDHDRAC
jgi:DNA-binding CsgD family transcriptional regulator